MEEWTPKLLIQDGGDDESERFLEEGLGESQSEAVAFYWERHSFYGLVLPNFDRALRFLAQECDAGELAPVAIRCSGEVLQGDALSQRIWDTPVYRE